MASEIASLGPQSRLVCAILAAQVSALCERIAGGLIVERLLGCGELLAVLATQLTPGSAPAAAAASLDNALDDLAFQHAQQQDLARQTAELVARALRLLAAAEPDELQAFSPGGLLALYVSDEQRRLHAMVLAEHATSGS